MALVINDYISIFMKCCFPSWFAMDEWMLKACSSSRSSQPSCSQGGRGLISASGLAANSSRCIIHVLYCCMVHEDMLSCGQVLYEPPKLSCIMHLPI